MGQLPTHGYAQLQRWLIHMEHRIGPSSAVNPCTPGDGEVPCWREAAALPALAFGWPAEDEEAASRRALAWASCLSSALPASPLSSSSSSSNCHPPAGPLELAACLAVGAATAFKQHPKQLLSTAHHLAHTASTAPCEKMKGTSSQGHKNGMLMCRCCCRLFRQRPTPFASHLASQRCCSLMAGFHELVGASACSESASQQAFK